MGNPLIFGYRFNERVELAFALDWQEVDYDATLQSATIPSLRVNVTGDLEAFTPRAWVNYNFMEGPSHPT